MHVSRSAAGTMAALPTWLAITAFPVAFNLSANVTRPLIRRDCNTFSAAAVSILNARLINCSSVTLALELCMRARHLRGKDKGEGVMWRERGSREGRWPETGREGGLNGDGLLEYIVPRRSRRQDCCFSLFFRCRHLVLLHLVSSADLGG